MKIATIYNYQETCILCTIQCQELGATGRQLSFKLRSSRDTAKTMFQCISNNYQYPKYILSYLRPHHRHGQVPADRALRLRRGAEVAGRLPQAPLRSHRQRGRLLRLAS